MAEARIIRLAIQYVKDTGFMALAEKFRQRILNPESGWLPCLAWLEFWLEQNGERVRQAVNQTRNNLPKPEHQVINLDFLFGPDWPGRALRHKPFFWYDTPLSEPEITQLMAHAMRYELEHAHRQCLCLTFLRAICRACGQPANGFEPNEEGVEVDAELIFNVYGKKGRFDLLFSWGQEKDTRLVAIEAKFDADLEDSQIEGYDKFLTRKLKQTGCEAPLKILLVKNNITDKYRDWHTVFWQELLPLWEEELKLAYKSLIDAPIDQSLAYGGQLRASIIQKIYGGIDA